MTMLFFLVGGCFLFLLLIALLLHGFAGSLSNYPLHRDVREVFTKAGDVTALLSISGMYLFWVMPVWYRIGLEPPYGKGFDDLSALIGNIPAHGMYLVTTMGLTFALFWLPAWLLQQWPQVFKD